MNGLPSRRPETLPLWRVHAVPESLPPRTDEPGPNRYDDPRPNAEDRFLVRYMATTLRGCLLESMAWLRPNAAAAQRLDDVTRAGDGHEPDPAEAVADYLATRRVAACQVGDDAEFTDIHAPATLAALDNDLNVEPLLASTRGRAALGELPSAHRPHLDQAAVLLASAFGRQLTQHCSLAIWDIEPPMAGLAYRSRHDLIEWCWAAYEHTEVGFSDVAILSPHTRAHREAVSSVAEVWKLPIHRWMGP